MKDKKWLMIGLPIAGVLIVCMAVMVAVFGGKNSVSGNNASGNTAAGAGDTVTGGSSDVAQNGNAGQTGTYVYGTGILDTGNLTETGNGYEGTPGTGDYNYGEALQKSLIFYELQRSGDIPEQTRCNWRGDSCMNDGADAGLDLTGGWYDAGDNVKFNLPMSYTASILGWSIIEDYDAYEESGQLEYALGNIKWANDYFIKCHPDDETYYYQVGNGSSDHSYWGAAETVEYKMDRPSYCVTADAPGSTVCAETAASLAVCSIVYKDIDSAYSEECLSHAKSLYDFAADSLSDAGYTMAAGFYDSHSGFYDELAWAGAWLYKATGDSNYLTQAKEYYEKAGQDYFWALCWDDVHIGAAMILAQETGESRYTEAVEQHLDWWTTGLPDGDRITYTPQGLAWLDTWGSLRYATTTAFIAAVYSEMDCCDSSKADTYWDFAVAQAGYALGDTGFSYEIGFGDSYPVHPHHRTAQGSYCDNMNEPSDARHTLYGALVGGPDSNDGYTDEVSNYTTNEVACDYNAGFTGLLAKLYSRYHGETLVDFGAVEPVEFNEFSVTGGINVDGDDFIELRCFICNMSAWPARVPENLEFRYYMDLSEIYEAGGSAENLSVTTNYMQGGTASGIICHDEDNHIYYLSVDFSGDAIYPGGQDAYKKEIQVRIQNAGGPWDNSNDPSFYNMTNGGNDLLTKCAIYENGVLIFGEEPASGENAGTSVVYTGPSSGSGDGQGSVGSQSTTATTATASNESVAVSIEYAGLTSSASSISGTLNITNNSDGTLKLSDLKIKYYFTNEDSKDLQFSCYHSAINGAGGSYTGVSGCSGKYEDCSGDNTDTACVITFSDSTMLGVGDTLTVNFCINHNDWSNMTTSNDYSSEDIENITIYNGSKLIFGNEP